MDRHCSEEILSAYLDGDLGSADAGRTAEHIAGCPFCRRTLSEVRTIRDAATGMEQPVPSGRTWAAIQERIRGRRTRTGRLARFWWFAVPALAAAVLVVVLAGQVQFPRMSGKGVAAVASDLSQEQAAVETARDYGEYVRGIDRAIDECRIALDENPGNARVRAAYSGARFSRQTAMDRLAAGGE